MCDDGPQVKEYRKLFPRFTFESNAVNSEWVAYIEENGRRIDVYLTHEMFCDLRYEGINNLLIDAEAKFDRDTRLRKQINEVYEPKY